MVWLCIASRATGRLSFELPILDPKTLDTPELAGFVGDDDKLSRERPPRR